MSSQEIEYVYLDEHPFMLRTEPRPTGSFGPFPMRTNYDKLLYGSGIAYISGLSYGGIYGTIRGLQTAQVPKFNVRVNMILNQMTRYGPWAANSMAMMTMGWALIDSALGQVRNTNDYYNHVSAAFLSGVVFKSTAGLKPAFLTGSILASVVSVYGLYDKWSSGEFSKSPASSEKSESLMQVSSEKSK